MGDAISDSPLTRACPSSAVITVMTSPPAGDDASNSGGPATTAVVTSTISVPSGRAGEARAWEEGRGAKERMGWEKEGGNNAVVNRLLVSVHRRQPESSVAYTLA